MRSGIGRPITGDTWKYRLATTFQDDFKVEKTPSGIHRHHRNLTLRQNLFDDAAADVC